jgi:integrase
MALQREERLAAGSEWRESGYFFTSRIGTPIEPRNLLRDYHALLALHQLPTIRFHDLRHAAATLLRARGVPTPVVAKLLGHSTPHTTETVYSHVIPEMETQAARTMDEIFDGVAVKVAVRRD